MRVVTIRSYVPADFETLYTIDQRCYQRGIAYSRRELRWYLGQRGAECVIAELAPEASGRPSACPSTVAKPREGETAALNLSIAGFLIAHARRAEAHVITLDVIGEHRRLGIGSRLLAHTEQLLAARGVRRMALETAIENDAAVAFWQRHGYRTVGTIRGYYLGYLDAYEMHKDLPSAG